MRSVMRQRPAAAARIGFSLAASTPIRLLRRSVVRERPRSTSPAEWNIREGKNVARKSLVSSLPHGPRGQLDPRRWGQAAELTALARYRWLPVAIAPDCEIRPGGVG